MSDSFPGASFGRPVFRISVYDKNRVFRGQIGNPASLTATVRHNLVSTLTMSVPLGHERIGDLLAPGARLRVSFKGEHLISGPVTADSLESDGVKGLYTVTVEDDFRALREILGWQVPAGTIDGQGAAEYRTYTGNAETIVKAAVTENGTGRLGVPGLTVAPNLGRGATIPGGVPLRMHPLMDQLFPAVESAGLGVTVRQQGTGLVLDVYEPVTHPRALSVKGRTLKTVGMTRARPTASRAIIGGSGEGKLRYFRAITDGPREVTYGMRAETFVDARDTGSDYLGMVKDADDAKKDYDKAQSEYNIAARAYTIADNAQEAADAAYDAAVATGNAAAKTKAQSVLTKANTAKADKLADLNTATTERNSKQAAYNTAAGKLPAALTAYKAAMDDAGTKALAEAGPKNGVTLELAGAGIFQYGPGGFHVGDRIPIEVADGVIITEVIRECALSWVSKDYASTEPVLGEHANDSDRIAASRIAALAKGQRNQERR